MKEIYASLRRWAGESLCLMLVVEKATPTYRFASVLWNQCVFCVAAWVPPGQLY